MGCIHSAAAETPHGLHYKDVHRLRSQSQYGKVLRGKQVSERKRRSSTQGKARYIKHFQSDTKTFNSVYDGDPKDRKLRLGKGVEGSVFKAKHKLSGLDVAVKVLNKAFLDDEEARLLRKEVEMLSLLDHPNVLRIIESYEDSQRIFLVNEYCTGGALSKAVNLSVDPTKFSLNDLLKGPFQRKKGLQEGEVQHIIAQISEALAYLHKRNMAHRDLKLDNIMILEPRQSDQPISQCTVKVIDFGFTEQYNETQTANVRNQMAASFKSHGVVGTGPFMAPEIASEYHRVFAGTESCLNVHKYDPQKTDCWALGVIAYTLLARALPFPDIHDGEFLKKVKNYTLDFRKGVWKGISEDAKDFIRGLLVVDPLGRMSMMEALKHTWLSSAKGSLSTGANGGAFSLACFDAYCNNLCPFRRALIHHLAIFCPKRETARLAQMFRLLDIEGNGIVTATELTQVLVTVSGKTIAEAVSEIDRYRPFIFGTSGELTFTRFLAAQISMKRFLENELFLEMLGMLFSQIDSDQDGFISADDMFDALVATEDITSCWSNLIIEMVEFLAPEEIDPTKSMVDFEAFQKFFKFTERLPHEGAARSFLCHDGSVFLTPANFVREATSDDMLLPAVYEVNLEIK